LVFSNYIGTGAEDVGLAITSNFLNHAIITGYTRGYGLVPLGTGYLPKVRTYDDTLNGAQDAFVALINLAWHTLQFCTYLGGQGNQDSGLDIAAFTDPSQSIEFFVTGATDSSDFPTLNALDSTYNGGLDAFVFSFNEQQMSLNYATYLGGSQHDVGRGIDIEGTNTAVVVGETASPTFPRLPRGGAPIQGANDIFVVQMSPSGSLQYAFVVGGSAAERGEGVAMVNAGVAFVVGSTESPDFPVRFGAAQTSFGGVQDAFALKIDDDNQLPTIVPETIGVRRTANGFFYLRFSNTNGVADVVAAYGLPADIGITGDWDGDGYETLGFWRPTTVQWMLSNTRIEFLSSLGLPRTHHYFAFGGRGDQPVVGDWNADGADGIGVWRGSQLTFYLRNTLSAGIAEITITLPFAEPSDIAIAGDWNCDGWDSPGLFRPSKRTFFLTDHVTTGVPTHYTHITFGGTGDLPFAGDWDGDGCSELGLYRNGAVLLKQIESPGSTADLVFSFGAAGDEPHLGNWVVPSAAVPLKPAPTFSPQSWTGSR
jgi:hypothetical protein